MKTKQVTAYSLLLAVALVLSYLESLLPVMIAVPGVKLGLANLITMLILYQSKCKNAIVFMAIRVTLAGLLFSGIFGILYSFAGGLMCILAMSIAKRFSIFSIIGVSVIGALFHNLGQVIVAAIVMETIHIMWYFPVLCISGLVSGILVGILSGIIIKKYNRMFPEEFL